MLKQLQFKLMLLLAVLLTGAGTAWAAEETISADQFGFTSNTNLSGDNATLTGTNFTLTFAQNESTTVPAYNSTSKEFRIYKISSGKTEGGSVTIASISSNITFTKIVFTFTNLPTNYSFSSGTYDKENNTWEGDATTSLTLTNTDTSGQLKFSSMTITYSTNLSTTYSVTYNGNGATSGDVPTDDTEYDAGNNIVTVLGNTGNLALEHYTFTGWNTAAAGTGTVYIEGNTFTISSNTTLYAQWSLNTNAVTLPEADQYGTYDMNATNPVAYGTDVTLNYTPAAGYEKYVATWSVNGVELAANKFTMPDEAVTVTVSLKKVLSMAIDFESTASSYSDWTFTNITSKKTNSGVTVHGGSYMGVTDGTATASIQTNEKVNPASLTCYVSKQTTNSTASKWYVQVSSNGTTWTDVKNIDGASMSKGEWKELTADLSSYSDVYVRVYYSGSTAVRCIDDLTLVLQDSDKPSITVADVNIEYDATSSSISYTLGNEPDPVGTLTAAITAGNEGNWLTLGNPSNGSIALTCSANGETTERTATVTLTYTYGESQTITKDVTITQAAAPVIYATIPALFDAATTTEADVNVTFTNWVVSGISTNGKYVFVTDGTNGFVIFSSNDQSSTYAVGDVLSGTTSCTLKLNNGYAQITSLDASDLTITSGGTVSAANIDLDALAGINTGALVSYTGLTCSVSSGKYYLSDGTTTIQLYTSLYNYGTTFEDGKTYNITGIYQQYNTTKEILPRSATDIVEVVVPTISLSENAVNATAADTDGTITVTYNNLTNYLSEVQFVASDGETAATYDWLDAEINASDDTKLDYTIGENTSTEARTAYMKVYAVGDEGDAYSELITITQAAPVVTTTYTLATSITPGKHYIITNGTDAAMGYDKGNNRAKVGITIDNGTASVASDAGVYEFVIFGPDAEGRYAIYDETSTKEGYLYAASSGSNYLKTQTTNNINGMWTITFDEGVASIVADGSSNRNVMQYNSSSSLFSCYASASQSPIYLFAKDNNGTIVKRTVHITGAGYATYCAENALEFTGSGMTAYIAKLEGSNVTFDEVTCVPANTGVLLKGEEGDWNMNVVASSGTNVSNNKLVGVVEDTKVPAGSFVLMNSSAGVGFYRTTAEFTVRNHSAYIEALPTSARFIGLDDNTTTGINAIENGKLTIDNEVYNLNGQRVAAPKKGLYIINGKKVLVK